MACFALRNGRINNRKAGQAGMQYDEVKELIAIFEKTDLNDMEVQLDNARIRLNRGAVSPWMVAAPPVMAAPQPAAVPQPVAAASPRTRAVPRGSR